MIYYVDIDNTICITTSADYSLSVPISSSIDKINRLYDEGNTIVYYTARGGTTKTDWREHTEKQLKNWGCRYTSLDLSKPQFDFIIDDKAQKIDEL